jgi:hypothetical protein
MSKKKCPYADRERYNCPVCDTTQDLEVLRRDAEKFDFEWVGFRCGHQFDLTNLDKSFEEQKKKVTRNIDRRAF